jgi:uncharacterized protein YegP (UPF0339 family)
MKTTLRLQVYRDKKGEWRWRLVRKGRILADSGEGYKRQGTMLRTLRNLQRDLPRLGI